MQTFLVFSTLGTMLFQAGAFSPVVGSLVWIEDPNAAWIDGEVVEVKGQDIKVLCTSGKTVCAFFIILCRFFLVMHVLLTKFFFLQTLN